jgi:hypothetical protein
VDQRWSTLRIVAKAVGERGDLVPVADENVSSRHLKRVIGEVSSSPEVVEHLLETAVGPGDAIVSRDGPCDVGGEELLRAVPGSPA